MITGMDKPFCAKHRRWPCAECGTSHYDGCKWQRVEAEPAPIDGTGGIK